jgi:hypothetical protein
MMPPLPKTVHILVGEEGKYYTETDTLAYGRQCVEAAAKICEVADDWAMKEVIAEAIRNMLKGETE